ncbi:uncharacterized protein [Ranitomeya imitator]|uniref:uncharacterized protein isoform X2 n=1 Tax=Ranitomeya imitator TaxID=111125 RepID=UPI0037E87D55
MGGPISPTTTPAFSSDTKRELSLRGILTSRRFLSRIRQRDYFTRPSFFRTKRTPTRRSRRKSTRPTHDPEVPGKLTVCTCRFRIVSPRDGHSRTTLTWLHITLSLFLLDVSQTVPKGTICEQGH